MRERKKCVVPLMRMTFDPPPWLRRPDPPTINWLQKAAFSFLSTCLADWTVLVVQFDTPEAEVALALVVTRVYKVNRQDK